MPDKNMKLRQEFVEEARQHLTKIEDDLLWFFAHRDESYQAHLLECPVCLSHSIKGSACFLGFTKIQELSHTVEDVLMKIKHRSVLPTSEILSILLVALDRLEMMIQDIHHSNDVDINDVVSNFEEVMEHNCPQRTLNTNQKLEYSPLFITHNLLY